MFNPVKPRDYGTTKDVVARLYEQAGGAKAVAFTLGLGISQTYAFADPQEDRHIKFDQVRRLTSPEATAAAEDLAALAGGMFVPGDSASGNSLIDLTAISFREHGEFAALLMQALVNGKLAAIDAPRVRRELDELIAVLIKVRGAMPAVQR